MAAGRRVRRAIAALAGARSSAEGAERINDPGGEVGRFLAAAGAELQLSASGVDRDGVKERVASRLERLEAGYGRRIMRGTGVLATIGATAPFVGLFGTVWGIMNSFIGISKSQTTNLAVVAPGIAEALLATALGLAAAIPAVVIYNVFARSIAGYRALVGDASAEVLRLVQPRPRPTGGRARAVHAQTDAAVGGGVSPRSNAFIVLYRTSGAGSGIPEDRFAVVDDDDHASDQIVGNHKDFLEGFPPVHRRPNISWVGIHQDIRAEGCVSLCSGVYWRACKRRNLPFLSLP